MKNINYAFMVGMLEAKLRNVAFALHIAGKIDEGTKEMLEKELEDCIRDAEKQAEEYAQR